MALKIGDKAPEFTLYDTDRKERSLKEFLGSKTVLAFYPGAFTGVCSKEMCTLRDSLASFEGMKAKVVGISVDAPAANKGFADVNKLGFPLLSDFTRTVSKAYVGLYENFGGVKGLNVAKRAVYVLDAQGTVKYAWLTETPGEEPKYDEIHAALKSF